MHGDWTGAKRSPWSLLLCQRRKGPRQGSYREIRALAGVGRILREYFHSDSSSSWWTVCWDFIAFIGNCFDGSRQTFSVPLSIDRFPNRIVFIRLRKLTGLKHILLHYSTGYEFNTRCTVSKLHLLYELYFKTISPFLFSMLQTATNWDPDSTRYPIHFQLKFPQNSSNGRVKLRRIERKTFKRSSARSRKGASLSTWLWHICWGWAKYENVACCTAAAPG